MNSQVLKLQRAQFPSSGPVLVYNEDRTHVERVSAAALPGYLRAALNQRAKIYVEYFTDQRTYGDVLDEEFSW